MPGPRDSAIVATTVVESIPPLRKAPSGTSLLSWILTASDNCARIRSSSSWSSCFSGGRGTSQYSWISTPLSEQVR